MQRRTLWALALVVLGLGMVGLSALPGPPPGPGWMTDVLISLGTAVLLFVPFYLLTRTLDRHIEEVRTETAASVQEVRTETAASVGELTEQVAQFREDVDRRLDDVATGVRARLAEERAADEAAFDSVRTAPSRDAMETALRRATALGLISSRMPPRVDVCSGQYLYVSVVYTPEPDPWGEDSETVGFRVEDIAGTVQASIPWSTNQTIEDVMVEVALVVRRESGEDMDVEDFFRGLADLLDAANTDPARRPAVQLCPPQWMVTTRGVVTYGNSRAVTLGIEKLRADSYIAKHIADKPWGNADSFDEAHMVALELFPDRSGEPPF